MGARVHAVRAAARLCWDKQQAVVEVERELGS